MNFEIIEILSMLFFLVAWIYSSVGFGGGSSYIALLIFFNFNYQVAPSLALFCNLIVAGSGFIHFYRQGHFRWSLFWPFALTSPLCAYWGGSISLKKESFMLILGISLLAAGMRMIFAPKRSLTGKNGDLDERALFFPVPPLKMALPLGSFLGFIAGLVGIGGGIFLTPLLHLGKWGNPKQIAATAAAFILLNSSLGLLGHLSRDSFSSHSFALYWPLFLAVFIGGQLGSFIGSRKLPQLFVEKITGMLILFVSYKFLT